MNAMPGGELRPEQPSIILHKTEKLFPGANSPALSSLDMEITGGAVTGLVGPDGAGKTTLIRMLAGLLAPSSGEIRVAGLDPVKQGAQLRGLIGYMPQRFGLYEDLTVRENLNLYAALRGIEKEARQKTFDDLLRFTGLAPFTKRLAGKLSGGMKQKLGLACTLLGTPQLLLLDEPSVGVDPISRRELWEMTHQLAEEGMLILWSTSYLDEAEQCRNVLLLNRGELLYAGPPGELTQGMEGRGWLTVAPDGDKRGLLQKAVSLPEISDGAIQGNAIRLILSKNARPDEIAARLGVEQSALISVPARFEDAFIDLLGKGPSRKSALTEILEQKAPDIGAPVIEAINLTKTFGDFTATDQINFQVQRGEIFGLLGPNGAGKSTTFKMMCGLLSPTSGKALVLGMDLQKQPGNARQRLGYMAQKFSLYGGLSVEQNLLFFSGVYGLTGRQRAQRVQEMTDAFNFSPILDQPSENLPLGFKQRLALACALMHRPDILFLDEPTSGVDPLTRREFWLHINGMVEKGVTVMVTTHFMDEAEYCDRIGLIYHGEMIAQGTPDILKEKAKTVEKPDPTMEDAFIHLIKTYDQAKTQGGHGDAA
ncbi:MAG: ATP-binding cassette domain-containing protein [Desulfovibrionaceae bacterium]|nr:ATP-binding cassette domain-containing protein [Desulfovibrionaceae bacterium]